MNKPIVEGIIATANHKLRCEGIESYKEYLAQPYYFEKELEEARKEEGERLMKIVKKYITHIEDYCYCGKTKCHNCVCREYMEELLAKLQKGVKK